MARLEPAFDRIRRDKYRVETFKDICFQSGTHVSLRAPESAQIRENSEAVSTEEQVLVE